MRQQRAAGWRVFVETGERVVVGVNRFEQEDEEPARALFRLDDRLERQRCAELQKHREQRPAARVRDTLKRLQDLAAGGENLMPHLVEAVDEGLTLGEICAAFEEVFGNYRPRAIF